MSSCESNHEGQSFPKGGVVNHYLNSVMAPLKTLSFIEGVLLVEELKAPKTTNIVEERLDDLEQKIFRYNTVVECSLDAHHFMNLELENKVEDYKERLKDLEDMYLHVISELDRYQSLMWDVENHNYEYKECFKIVEAATLRYNDPPTSFNNGRPFPWKVEEWGRIMGRSKLKKRKQKQLVKLGGVQSSLYL